VFTIYVIVLFGLIGATGWQLGLIRLEDVALGVGISVVVALLLWPRGARRELADSAFLVASGSDMILFGDLIDVLADMGYRGNGHVDGTDALSAQISIFVAALRARPTAWITHPTPTAQWRRCRPRSCAKFQ